MADGADTDHHLLKRRSSGVIILIFLLLNLAGSCSTASLKSGCRKGGYKVIIDEHGCDMVAVSVNVCSGYCLSFSFMNPLKSNDLSVHTKCCRMIDVEMISVKLQCGNEIREVKVPSATECGCIECA